jgi:hypothetical protein
MPAGTKSRKLAKKPAMKYGHFIKSNMISSVYWQGRLKA